MGMDRSGRRPVHICARNRASPGKISSMTRGCRRGAYRAAGRCIPCCSKTRPPCPPCKMHEVRQVVVQAITRRLEPLLRQQPAGTRSATRTDPSGWALAGCTRDQIDRAPDIGPLLVLVEIVRHHVDGVGMGHDVVSRFRYPASAWRSAMIPETIMVALTFSRASVSSTRKIPCRWPYSAKPMALRSGTPGFERISHRANAGPMTVRPAFECATKEHRQSLAAGGAANRPAGWFRRAGVNAEPIHLTIRGAPTCNEL